MPLIPLACPFCGGDCEVNSDHDAAVCKYCNRPFIIKDAIVHNYVNNVTNVNAQNVNFFTRKDYEIRGGVLEKYNGEAIDVVVPDSVIIISGSVFSGLPIRSVLIPESVTSIGGSAFKNCTSLQKVSLPESVTSISYETFYGCSSLQEVFIPESVTSIEDSAFENCTSLQKVTLSDHLKCLSCSMFYGCSSLTSIVIPDQVKDIRKYAFCGCANLRKIVFPHNLQEIGDGAFCDCHMIEKIELFEGIETIGKDAFKNCSKLSDIGNKNLIITDYSFLETPILAEHRFWRANSRCQHCGGKFAGIINKQCRQCGKPKDYVDGATY